MTTSNADTAAKAEAEQVAATKSRRPPGRGTGRRRPTRGSGLVGVEAVLFEPPGPRGRRRIAMATVAGMLVAVAAVFLLGGELAAHGQLSARQWRPFTQWPIIRYLLSGLVATLEVAAVAGALALPASVFLALCRLARNRLLRWSAGAFVEVLRAVPLLLLVYAFLLGLPETGLRVPLFWQLVWPIVLSNSAALAEIFRAGVRAVPRGQSEAALSLGLGYRSTMRLVVLPQAVRHVAPALVSQLIRLLKDSTLGYVVSYLELLNAAKVLGEYDGTVLQSFLVVAAIYIVINSMLAATAARLERRYSTFMRAGR
jgi:glutamate transport system permease protein